jgi:hypothetical protein
MAKPPKPVEIVTFPSSFRLSAPVVYGLAIFGAYCMYAMGMVLHSGRHTSLLPVGVITIIALALFITVASAVVRVDENGINERWLFLHKVTPWSEIGVMDRHKSGCTLKSTAGRDLIVITLLTVPQQDAIAQEAIDKAGLHLSNEKITYPVKERWTK